MNLTVKNAMGEQFNILAIRYFKFNGINYLIFTKNEIDEAGYQKLYISKINNMVGNNIDDEVEWNLVRDTIKAIAKANKDNSVLPVQDLNEMEINGIQIVGQKPFKLTVASVTLLGANKNVMPQAQNVVPPAQAVPVEPLNNVQPVTIAPVEPTPAVNFGQPITPTDIPNVTPEPVIPQVQNTVDVAQPVMPQFTAPVEPAVPVAPQPVVTPVQQNPVEPFMPNTVVPPVEPVNTNPTITPVVNNQPITTVDPFSFEMPSAPQPTMPQQPVAPQQPVVPTETVDYKKLYEEQTLKLNALTVELDKYKAIVDQLKNILN